MARIYTRLPLEERFWRLVDKRGDDGCWLWTGSLTKDGYGHAAEDFPSRLAHRVAYLYERGPIPDRIRVDHVCDKRRCVRPSHLRLRTDGKRMQGARPLAERFWEKVDKNGPGGCWLWSGYHGRDGYGRIRVQGTQVPLLAHRTSYELNVGPIPTDLTIDHLCRVRHCVNPDHLEPVTGAENIRRGVSHNSLKTHCPRGHPYDEANTQIEVTRDGKQRRHCRACQARWSKARKKS